MTLLKTIAALGLLVGLIYAFIFLTGRKEKAEKVVNIKEQKKNLNAAKICLQIVDAIAQASELDLSITPEKIREKIITLYNLLLDTIFT